MMNSIDNKIAKIMIAGIEDILHKSALQNSSTPRLLKELKFKTSEGINKYNGGGNKFIQFSSVFTYRVKQATYARNMKVINIANYALPNQESYTLVELLVVEAIYLYACFIKDVQKSHRSAVELTKIIIGKTIYNDFKCFVESCMSNASIPNSFDNEISTISPIPIDFYIVGDEVFFKHESGFNSGVIKRKLKKGFKVLTKDKGEILVSSHAIV